MNDAPGRIEHPAIMPDGVYFGLPEEQYHQAVALSASGMKWLRVSSMDWWARSPLNADPDDEEDSDARIIGTAYHKRILEGRDAFYARYAPEIDPLAYPDAIRTNEEIIAAIEAASGPQKGLKGLRKADLVARLADIAPQVRVWETLCREHAERHAGKEMLSAKVIRRIEIAAKMIEAHPQLCKAFVGGYPEVSIFWTDAETGCPRKSRLDYWKPRAITDLKSFDNRGIPLDKAIAKAVAGWKYHFQARFYLDAVEAARGLIAEGKVFGAVETEFLGAVSAANDCTFLFVFQAKGPAPVARGKVLAPGMIMDIARMEIDQALTQWARCWETYGADPWVDIADISTFDDQEFPVFLTE